MRCLAPAAIVVVLTGWCGGGDEREAVKASPPTTPSAAAKTGRLASRPPQSVDSPAKPGLRSLGAARLYVPRGDGAKRLVVTLHGATETPGAALSLLRPYADDAGLILLAPKSKGPTWDIAQGGFGPDVAAIDALLEQVFSEYEVDDVAVAGFSDGASYALSLGLANGDLFRSVVAFSAGSSRSESRKAGRASSSRTAPTTRCFRSGRRAGAASRGSGGPATPSSTASSTAATRSRRGWRARPRPG